MTATIWVSLLVCVLGGLVYLASSNHKLQELGRIAFACGLLATLIGATGGAVRI